MKLTSKKQQYKEKYNSSLDFNEIEFRDPIKIKPESLGGFFFKMTGCIIEAMKEDDMQALKDKLVIMQRLLIHKIPSCTGRKRLLDFYKLQDEFVDHAALSNAIMYATNKGTKNKK